MRLGSALPRFALRRPVTVAMVFLAFLVLGSIAWKQIPVQLMPGGYNVPYLWLWVPYQDANPREIEQSIVRPMEDALETVPDLRTMRSRAATDHAGFQLQFEQHADMSEAWSDVMDRAERTMPELPDDAERYFVYKYNPSDQPVLWAAVTYPDSEDDPAYLLESRLVRSLERVPGVARVEYHGVHRARVYIDFHREAIERHGVNLYEVMESLEGDSFTVASGEVRDGGRVTLVRGVANYEGVESIASRPISGGLRLDDIATVVFGRPASTYIHRVNGQRAASLDVYKESGANTVAVCERVAKALSMLEQDPKLAGWTVERFFDQGALIQESIDNLFNAAIQGGTLAILVLFLFLRRLRATLLIALSIPMSLLMTLVVMYFLGESINLLSMMGLMLAVGMVVDNSIVVVEAIFQRREDGDSARESALRGTSEVALAILAATATTLVVFLPIILMSDDADFSFFMGRLGLPVCFALASSLLVALVFVPLVTSTRIGGQSAPPARWLSRLTERYVGMLRAALSRRSTSFLVLTVALASMWWPMEHLDRTDQDTGGIVDFVVTAQFPAYFDSEQVEHSLLAIEQILLDKREEWKIRAVRTRSRGYGRGRVMAFMEERERGDIQRDEILEKLEDLLPDEPGVEVWTGWSREEGAASRVGNEVSIRLAGDDSEVLAELGREVVGRLRESPGIVLAEVDDLDDGMDEMAVTVDRERAVRYGVATNVLAQTIAFGFRGTSLRPLVVDGKLIPVQAEFRREDRLDLDALEDFQVWSTTTGQVPVAAVADIGIRKGYREIERENRKTSIGIRVGLADDDLEQGREDILAALASLRFPRGYTVDLGGRFDALEEQDRAAKFALLMSVAFVFLLMGMLFESVWTPLCVALSIPLALFGVYWTLYLWKTPFEIMAGIGLVVLVGIVVNNAIVLVDRIQQHRTSGLSRDEAIVQGGRDRFRPIVMTAMTTIVGLLPMALGDANLVGISYQPLGRAIIGGLVASTMLTLVLVPLLYTYLDDLQALLAAALRRAVGRRDVQVVGMLLVLVLPVRTSGASDGAPPSSLQEDIEAIESAPGLGSDARDLSQTAAISRSLESNLGLRVQLSELEAARFRLKASWGQWVPQWGTSWRYRPWKSERWFDQYKSWERVEGSTADYNLSLGLNSPTGTSVSAVWSQGSYDQLTTYDPEVVIENPFDPDTPIEVLVNNEFHTRWSSLALEVNQSLLKGIAPFYNLQSMRQARAATTSAELVRDQEIATVVADTLKAYWDLAASLRIVEISRINHRLGEDQREVTRARIAAGDLAPIELLRIDETVASRSADLLEARRAAAEAEQSLKTLMGLAPDEESYGQSLQPVDGPTLDLPVRGRENSQQVALQQNPQLLLNRNDLDERRISWKLARHELLPTLDLNASLALNGTGFDAAESVSDVFSRKFPDFTVGMNLRVPLPDLGAIHGVKAADQEVAASLLRLQQVERSVLSGVESALRAIESYDAQLEVAAVRVSLAGQTADASEATYRAGRNTLRDVLEAQVALKEARQAQVVARVESLKARLDLEVLRGSLLDVLGLEID